MKENTIEIFKIKLLDCDYPELIELISGIISGSEKKSIGYLSFSQLYRADSDETFKSILNSFDYLHADGIGTYLASKILLGGNGLSKRINGSDLYPLLASKSIQSGWKLFFLGDTDGTLQQILRNRRDINVTGLMNGFNFNAENTLLEINKCDVDLLIVGLGSPLQEEWIYSNKNKLNAKLILAVGDGIKVFAGTKLRGPKFMRVIGLEWLIRLCRHPRKMWRRYLIGIPLFIFKVIHKYFNRYK